MKDLERRDQIAIEAMKSLLDWDKNLEDWFDIANTEAQYEKQLALVSYALADAMLEVGNK